MPHKLPGLETGLLGTHKILDICAAVGAGVDHKPRGKRDPLSLGSLSWNTQS